MRTKDTKVCDAVRLEVDCVANDPESIQQGGARRLGYDFVVDYSKNLTKVEDKIKALLKKYKRPFLQITRHEIRDYNVHKLWTMDKIEECIKNEDVCE